MLEFYEGARGHLKPNAEFDKAKFYPYANSVTTSKMLLLQENLPNGVAPIAGLQPKVISHLLSDLTGQPYDFARLSPNGAVIGATIGSPIVITTASTTGLATGDLVTINDVTGNTAANGTFTITVINATSFRLNGATGIIPFAGGGRWTQYENHGGNIMTVSMPGVTDVFGEPASARQTYTGPINADLWLSLIDGDHNWRQDSQTRASEVYHFHDAGTGANTVEWRFTGLTPGATYTLQTDWQLNEHITDQGRIAPAQGAYYRILSGSGAQLSARAIDQRSFPDDLILTDLPADSFEPAGQAWENVGTVVAADGTLRVVLNDLVRTAAFDAANITGNDIDIGTVELNTGAKVIDLIAGQKVVYHKGSGSSGNLVDGATYFVNSVGMNKINLAATSGGTALAVGAISGTGHVLSIGEFVVAGRVRLEPQIPGLAVIRTNKDIAPLVNPPLYIENAATLATVPANAGDFAALNARTAPPVLLNALAGTTIDDSDSLLQERDILAIRTLVFKIGVGLGVAQLPAVLQNLIQAAGTDLD